MATTENIEKKDKNIQNKKKNHKEIKAIILIALGIIFLIKTLFNINIFGELSSVIKKLRPLILIYFGLNILLKNKK